MTIRPPKGLPITGSSTTVQAISWKSVGLIDSGSDGWLSIAGLEDDKLEGVFVLLSEGDSI